MRNILAVLLLIGPLTATAEIYKWRDDKGVWHFGDEAPAGAEKVELPPATVYSAPPLTRTDPAPAPQPADGPGYTAAAIATPGPEATLRNATGEVPVSVALDPGLRAGHRVRLLLDQEAVGEPVATTQFTLRNVSRGEHTVSAEILDGAGRVLTRTGNQTFFLHRPSALR